MVFFLFFPQFCNVIEEVDATILSNAECGHDISKHEIIVEGLMNDAGPLPLVAVLLHVSRGVGVQLYLMAHSDFTPQPLIGQVSQQVLDVLVAGESKLWGSYRH